MFLNRFFNLFLHFEYNEDVNVVRWGGISAHSSILSKNFRETNVSEGIILIKKRGTSKLTFWILVIESG